MDRDYLRWTGSVMADRIIAQLQKQQFLRPHQPLAEAIQHTGDEEGFCPQAGCQAMQALNLAPATKIGRLKRCELVQLARAIYRVWRQSLEVSAQSAQPA